MLTKYTLPYCPSKNNWLGFSKGHVYTTKAYKEWKEIAYWQCLNQGLKAKDFEGADKIVIKCWWFKPRANADSHNGWVALCDVIQDVIKINDSQFLIQDMDFEVSKHPRVEFTVEIK